MAQGDRIGLVEEVVGEAEHDPTRLLDGGERVHGDGRVAHHVPHAHVRQPAADEIEHRLVLEEQHVGLAEHADQLALGVDHRQPGHAMVAQQLLALGDRRLLVDADRLRGHEVGDGDVGGGSHGVLSGG
jgi:hypothetical protein